MSHQPHVLRRDAGRVCEVCVCEGCVCVGGRGGEQEEEQREMEGVLEERKRIEGERKREEKGEKWPGKSTFLFKPSLCCSILFRTNLKCERTIML